MTPTAPWGELLALRDRLTQLVEGSREGEGPAEEVSAWSPAVDAYECGGRLFVAVEVPGMAVADLRVRVEGRSLVVEGERRPTTFSVEAGRARAFRVDRVVGPFRRVLPLRRAVQAERGGVKAALRAGLLRIEVETADGAETTGFDVPINEGA